MTEFKAVMEIPQKVGKDGCIGVVVVEAPGCFSAGDTKEEAKVMAKEALEIYLGDWFERYGHIPQPDKEASWDDYAGEEWEVFTVVVDTDEIERNAHAQGQRPLIERIGVKLHNFGAAAERKIKSMFRECS